MPQVRPGMQSNDQRATADSSNNQTKMNNSNNGSVTTTPTHSRIVAQLPSPPETLTGSLENSQSTLDSAPDDDGPPARPSTPQRGRSDPRYPSSLGPGRVPLHRRGTSNTYERMEDLLREAGYKETRVFTPETERAEVEAEERRERALRRGASVRNGVDAVVGFIAGLVNRAPSVVVETRAAPVASGSRSVPQQEYSPPPSPLAHKHHPNLQQSIYSHSRPSSPPAFNPNMSSESLKLSPKASPSYRLPNRSANATPRPRYQDPYSQSPTRPSRLRPQPSFSSNSSQVPQTYAEASKARLYLRHMASAPTIQPVPSLNFKAASVQRHSSSRYANRGAYVRRTMVLNDADDNVYTGRKGNGEGEEDPLAVPPLPRTWLESVARAVLFGGTGTYIGGPPHISPPSPSPSYSHSNSRSPKSRLDALRGSPSSSKSALLDHTSVVRHKIKGHAPPLLFAQVATQRAPSESRVSRTRVVCQSAPVSRSASKVRVAADWGLHEVERGRDRRSGGRGQGDPQSSARNKNGKGKAKSGDTVPSLARTHAQNDDWGKANSGDEMMNASAPSSEDDDEGELDLARLLVPAKRQNSIRSLRKHLHASGSHPRIPALPQHRGSWDGSGTRSATGSVSRRKRGLVWSRDQGYEDEEWQSGRGRGSLKVRRGKGMGTEGEQEDGILFSTEGRVGIKRTGNPGTWDQRHVES